MLLGMATTSFAFFETYLLDLPPDARESLRGLAEVLARFDSEGATLRERLDAALKDLYSLHEILRGIQEERKASELSEQESKFADLAGDIADELRTQVRFLERSLQEQG